MFDISLLDESSLEGIRFIEIRDEIRRRLETVFTGMTEIGWISLYLENRDTWPLITIESYNDGIKPAGSGNSSHIDEVRVRATIKCMKQDKLDPDSLLRYFLHQFQLLLWPHDEFSKTSGYFLTTPSGKKLLKQDLSELQPALFVLPEPGLPFASVHLSLKLEYIQPKK